MPGDRPAYRRWTGVATVRPGVAGLAGRTLAEAGGLKRWAADRSGHCTHMLDLALLAVRHAGGPGLEYEIVVRPSAGRRRAAWLRRDGDALLAWRLDGTTVTDPPSWSGVDIAAGGFVALLRKDFPGDVAEAAIVLRRACHIAGGDVLDLDGVAVAGDVAVLDGSCHTLVPAVAARARRIRGSSIEPGTPCRSYVSSPTSASGEHHGE